MKKLISLIAMTLASALVLGSFVAAAGTAVLSLSPASGSYNTDSTLSAGIWENGTSVNVVTVSLTYDPAKLQFTGASCGGSFPNTVIAATSTPKITCSVTPGSPAVSGSAQVGVVNFKVLGTSTTSLSFASDTQVASSGTNVWNGSPTGGTYSLTIPAATTPAATPSSTTTPTEPTITQTNASGSTKKPSSNQGNNSSSSTAATGSVLQSTTQNSDNSNAKSNDKNIAGNAESNSASATKDSGRGFSSRGTLLIIIFIAVVIGIYREKIIAFAKRNKKLLVKGFAQSKKAITNKYKTIITLVK